MVKHVILWKLKEQHNTDEVKQGIKQNLEGLLGKIDGLVQINVHIDGLASSNADVMLDSLFNDEKSLKGYAIHPDHVEVANTKVRPYTSARSCMDFEI